MSAPLVATIRTLAILQGLFLASASCLDILGLVPHSEATPSLAQRAAHSAPLAATGVLLLIPYRSVGARGLRIAIACGLCLLVGCTLYLTVDGVAGYLQGLKSWHVVPAALLFLALTVGNLWAFTRITSGGRTPRPKRTEAE